LADEADLKFQIAAEAYQRGEYRTALEHFLGSNRLVPNKNVVFNIARCYEKLGKFPEAYRYYAQALAAEEQADARSKIEAALAHIQPEVAVLRVITEPSGAVLYVDRRDLGPRGNAPLSLGLSSGRTRIIAELPGYHPAEAVVDQVTRGRETTLRLVLSPILGTVLVLRPPGARVESHPPSTQPACTVPCTLRLPPGRRRLRITRAGYRPAEIPADSIAQRQTTLSPELERLTGNLLVSTDEPAALIEVDGEPRGFTPAILRLNVGKHRVRVSLFGFRPLEQTVKVEQDQQHRLDLELSASEEVLAASRRAESVADAPSSVTIIPRQELRAFAYPTIGEALRGVTGVALWDDRSYVAVGVRGLGRLGSYGNRLLVLEDGQSINDNWIGSSYVGYDAMSDLGDVERIEVVRGPGSALYGTGAFAGVVNVVGRRELSPGVEAGVSTNLDGVARGRLRADLRLARESGVWASVAAARGQGRDFYFPELVYLRGQGPGDQPGMARGVDGFEAGTTHGRWWWRWVTVQWSLHRHSKQLPGAQYETLLGDPRSRQTDTRSFVEVRAEPKVSSTVTLLSRIHLNQYAFRGTYPKPVEDGGVEVDRFRGQWLGVEQRAVYTPSPALRLTLGGEAQFHYLVEQRARDDNGYFLDQAGDQGLPYRVGALYLVADSVLGPKVRVSAGTRIDGYSTFGSSVNPRLALILRPYERGNSKFLLGKAFRAPSVYELYYNDDGYTQVASPDLSPESIYSAEIEHSHRFSPTVTGSLAVFINHVQDLVDIASSDNVMQFYNSKTPLAVAGVELSLRREWRQGWMIAASYAHTEARFLAGTRAADLLAWRKDPERREASNVPSDSASVKAAIPILSRNVLLANRWTLEGPRWDRYERSDDPEPQQRSDWVVVWDLVLTGHDRWNLDWSVGAYNLFDWQYSLPVGGEFRQRMILQNGRTFLASVEARF
jgi:outer membrane receptor for ferrienterochelin and colicin